MPTSPTVDFGTLSVTGADGSDLIEQTEGVSPVEGDGYKGFLALSQRLSQLLSKGTISPEEFDRLRDKLRTEAKKRDYDLIHRAQMADEAADGTTVRVELHDDEPKITIATSDSEALEGAERIAREWQATSITRISSTVISCTFLSAKHQEEAANEMFGFWAYDTSVTTFKGDPIPHAAN
jgi:aldehyde:ferredoxin oxidoreductase